MTATAMQGTAANFKTLPAAAFQFTSGAPARFESPDATVDRLKNPPPKAPSRREEEDAIRLERQIEQTEDLLARVADLLQRLKSARGKSGDGAYPAADIPKDFSAGPRTVGGATSSYTATPASRGITPQDIQNEMRNGGGNAVQAFERLFASRTPAAYTWTPGSGR